MNTFNVYEWINTTKGRYYSITIRRRHSGKIILDYKWGGCNSNRGGQKNIEVYTDKEAHEHIVKMMKRRKGRGYDLIFPLSRTKH